MSDDDVVLRLDRRRALVLFEFVSRFSDDRELSIQHHAEERVLWDICADLERELVEPLRADYEQCLADAREQVADDSGPRGRT